MNKDNICVRDIVKKYLIENNYDGLHRDSECGCKIDDLMVCDDIFCDCQPGIIINCNQCDMRDDCDSNYCIGEKI